MTRRHPDLLIVVFFVVVVVFTGWLVWTGINDDDRESECLARGGTVVLDARNRYNGCLIGGDR